MQSAIQNGKSDLKRCQGHDVVLLIDEMNTAELQEHRLTELEIRITEQDHLVEELNKVIYEQQKQIDGLIKKVDSLQKQSEDPTAPRNEKPPHY